VERSSGAAPPLSSRGSGEPQNGQTLRVRIEPVGASGSVISLSGELDLSTMPRLEKQLFQQIHSKACVVVDLTNVTFIDSSGIGLLIRAYRATDESRPLNTVIAADSQVDRVFRLAGIDRALPLFTERASALESLNAAAAD
jgi:anti-anti-sigma factor